MKFTCENCNYYYQDEIESDNCIVRNPPYCHWIERYPDDLAPCETDRYNYLSEYEEE